MANGRELRAQLQRIGAPLAEPAALVGAREEWRGRFGEGQERGGGRLVQVAHRLGDLVTRINSDVQQIETLVRWHEDVAVTEHELHRNQAIFEIQGNRNPFIDHPEWAASIFSLASSARVSAFSRTAPKPSCTAS